MSFYKSKFRFLISPLVTPTWERVFHQVQWLWNLALNLSIDCSYFWNIHKLVLCFNY